MLTPSQQFVQAMERREEPQIPFVDADNLPPEMLRHPSQAVLVFSGVSPNLPELSRSTWIELSTGRVHAHGAEMKRWLESLHRVFVQSGGDAVEFGQYFRFWKVYDAARAPATRVLVAVCVAMFVLETLLGGSESEQVLLRLGAGNPMLVSQGQWWRLVGETFLHIGLTHIAVNMYALWVLGTQVERFFGTRAFLGLYALAGVGGSLVSYLFGPPNVISAGASGAIFGLFGAAGLLSFKRDLPRAVAVSMRKNVLINVALNVGVAMSVSGLDQLAHLGGLVTGALFALIVPTATREKRPEWLLWGLASLGGAYFLVELVSLYHAFQ